MHCSTTFTKFGFSKAAATLSLSLICLVISWAVECVPSFTFKSILNLPGGNSRFSLVLKHNPIKVAKEQWGTVGTNTIVASRWSEFIDISNGATETSCSWTTFSSSKVSGFSGSWIVRIKSYIISRHSWTSWSTELASWSFSTASIASWTAIYVDVK